MHIAWIRKLLKIINLIWKNRIRLPIMDYFKIYGFSQNPGAFQELKITISIFFLMLRVSWNFKSNVRKGDAHLYRPQSRERKSTIDRCWESSAQEMMFARDRLKLHEILFRSWNYIRSWASALHKMIASISPGMPRSSNIW